MCLVSPLKWTKHHICFTPDYWIVTCSELVKDTDVEYKDINSSSDDGQIDSLYFWESIRTKTLFVTLYKAAWSSQWHLGVHDLTSNREWKYFCILEIKMDHKTKVDQQHRFFLRIFFPTHFDHWKPKYGSWHYCILWILGTCLHEKSWSTFFWCHTHLLNISF